MPELPEVETTRKDLERYIKGANVSQVKLGKVGLRHPFPERFAASLESAAILAVERRGKFLLLRLDNDQTWVTHLGMTGHFRIAEEKTETAESRQASTRKHLRFECIATTTKGAYRVEYHDQRRFGYMLLIRNDELPEARWYADLGPEPLSKEFSENYLFERAQGRRADCKTLLTDQGCVAGIGNAYVCDALWAAKIKPDRPARTLAFKEAGAVVKAIKDVLADAIKAGDAAMGTAKATGGRDGYFEYHYRVYDQEGAPCPRSDGGVIERVSAKGRSTFFCPVCQR